MRRGFTLIELIATVIILGVLATLMTSRVVARSRGAATSEVEQIIELLGIARERTNLTSQQVAVMVEDDAMRIQTFRREDDWSAEGEWKDDGLTDKVELTAIEIVELRRNGGRLDADQRCTLADGGIQATIELEIEETRGDRRWNVVLRAGATRARFASELEDDLELDLDLAGQGEDPW